MASVSYDYECDMNSGFMMDPNQHKRVGYVTSFGGLVTGELAQDLVLAIPFNGNSRPLFTGFQYHATGPATSARVSAVIDKFSWAGGVGDALKFEFYVSQSNAMQIKSLQQSASKTTNINGFSWWIGNYDQEAKVWFEQSYPQSGPVNGVITGGSNSGLEVDLNPVLAKGGINVDVYRISLAVSPAANKQYSLAFANSSTQKTTKAWGLVVGTLA